MRSTLRPAHKPHPFSKRSFQRSALVLALASALYGGQAQAVEPFVAKDIRVEGLQRTEAGTVFAQLPFRVGG